MTWWDASSASHLMVGLGVAIVGSNLSRSYVPRVGPLYGGLLAGAAAGVTKEGLDLLGFGTASWMDLFWTILGTAIGTGLDSLAHALLMPLSTH